MTQQMMNQASRLNDLVKYFVSNDYPTSISVQLAIAALNAAALQNISESINSLDTKEIAQAIAQIGN